jgi:hypothetical protein
LSWLTAPDEEGWQMKRKYEQELMVTLEKQLGKIRKLTVKFGKGVGMVELEGEQEDAERSVAKAATYKRSGRKSCVHAKK